jgi:hypothetical protein
MFFPWAAELLRIGPTINYSNEGGKGYEKEKDDFQKRFLTQWDSNSFGIVFRAIRMGL